MYNNALAKFNEMNWKPKAFRPSQAFFSESGGMSQNINSKVVLITETSNCLPPELLKEDGTSVIPLSFFLNGKEYRDQVDISAEEFWRIFDTVTRLNTTAPSPGNFADVFNETAQRTGDIARIPVSQATSATNKSAPLAKDLLNSQNHCLNIEVIDTRTAGSAVGLIALEATRAACDGKNLSEMTQVAQDLIPRTKWVCGIDSMKDIIKAGRAPKTASMEDLLNKPPIITQGKATGVVEDLGIVNREQECLERLVELVGENCDTSHPLPAMVHYTNNIAKGRKLKQMVSSKNICAEIYLTPYSPLLSGFTWPCLATAFFS
jgi:DegV family protein with EDD domain